jgi:DNA-binding winged helix-turn-helix (wHTH) protein/tetratricopeptide (TPR) repeat protein
MPDVSRLAPFTVGDWLVDPKTCRLSRGDTVVKLRPQLVDLLICLAGRAGEVVLKDEILAEVWSEQYIAESGFSRCVAELRQSLEDDPQQPRFIETFPKRGYRLIAPVVWLSPAAPADPAVPCVGPGPDAASPGAGDGRAPTEQAAPMPVDAPPGPLRAARWRRGVRAAGLVGLLAIVISVASTLVRPPASVLTERDAVLLGDVNNMTGDRVFDGTLRLALAVHLEQAPFLRILPQDVVRAAVVRAGRPPDERVVGSLALDICRREGAAVLLAGSIGLLGSRYAVGVEALTCGTGEVVSRALEEAGDKEHVLEALERAATHIREDLGESRASLSQHNVPLAQATTPSFEALQALTLGDHARDHARPDEAIAFYRQATELDPVFAVAWARRGAAAMYLGLPGEAVPAFRRAYELRDRVSAQERFYIVAHYYRIVTADPERALETYQAWKQMYPGSAVAATNLASVLSSWMGQYDKALPEAREAVRLAPNSAVASSNLVIACLGSGRAAEAAAVLAEAASRGQNDRLTHQLRLTYALYDGNRESLDREIRWAAGDPAAALTALSLRASAAMAGGRLREGRALWSEAVAKAGQVGPAGRAAEVHLLQAEAEALVGDARAARTALSAGLAADTGVTTVISAALVHALVGDLARSRAILDDARQKVQGGALQRVWLPVAQALSASVSGRADEARTLLQPVSRFERGYAFGLVPLGVRAIVAERAHRSAEAAAAFENLVSLRAIVPASPWVPFARLGLARALRESGEATGSAAAYDAFLESWRGADPDAPLLAAARRERAALSPR